MIRPTQKKRLLQLLLLLCPLGGLADVSVPAIFGDHMVFQRERKNPVWGKADPDEKITVTINGQIHTTTAAADGRWRVLLDPLPTGGPYSLTIEGKNVLTYSDVLSGEVWICAGQSNMDWTVANSAFAPLEALSANYPQIRLLSVPSRGRPDPQFTFDGSWKICSPDTVGSFSAIGYLFGQRLHKALNVPIGLIDNAWGGSPIEGWLPLEKFADDDTLRQYLAEWDASMASYTDETYQSELAAYDTRLAAWESAGRQGYQPNRPRDSRFSNSRPANVYHTAISPLIGFGIRGVIWYQGESNTRRAYSYRYAFRLLIESWREGWGQGDFPFYWVQLARFTPRKDLAEQSRWAELRESQSHALALPNTGQVVAIDTGEANNIHPEDKQTIANRLAMLALSNDYGKSLPAISPTYASAQFTKGRALLHFAHVDKGLRTFDMNEILGFTIAGENKVFVPAKARIADKDSIEVWSDEVPIPVAVRYAWAHNPPNNVRDDNGLPLTPFRTDDWHIPTQPEN